MVQSSKQRLFTAVKRRNKSVYTSIYSYTIPAFGPKNPEFPGIFVSIIEKSRGQAKAVGLPKFKRDFGFKGR